MNKDILTDNNGASPAGNKAKSAHNRMTSLIVESKNAI